MRRFLSTLICAILSTGAFLASDYAHAQSAPDSQKGWSRSKISLRRLMPPPRDQGEERNTSAAFAATSLVEFLIRAEVDEETQLSVEWAYTQGRAMALSPTSPLHNYYRRVDDLPGFSAVMAFELGAPLESDWPYSEAFHPKGRITYPTPPNLGTTRYRLRTEFVPLKDAGQFLLHQNRPIVVTLWWYPRSVESSGKVVPPSEQERKICAETRQGCFAHSVLLVGYNRETKIFTFRNSKGELWGDRGYGTLSEESLLKDTLGNYGDWSKLTPAVLEQLRLGVSGRLIELKQPTAKAGLKPQP